jgi:multisubunit Na+/H+ antiporter MnhB subunit
MHPAAVSPVVSSRGWRWYCVISRAASTNWVRPILAAGTASVSLLLGAPPLSSVILETTVPLLGHVKLVTSLFFDLGVYLIVVGLVLDVLRSLGARLDDELVQS